MDQRYKDFSLELDCPPGNPRPFELIDCVLKDTGLVLADFSTGAPMFGHQTWILIEGDEAKDRLFTAAKPTFQRRIGALYKRGLIRFGSW